MSNASPLGQGQPAPSVSTIEAAIELHRAGRMDEAERIYRTVLAEDREQPVALHFLGLLSHQRGDNKTALSLIERAIERKPDYAAALVNLGTVLEAEGRADEAIATFRRACVMSPDLADAHRHFGLALRGQGRAAEAASAFRDLVKAAPADANGHLNLALSLLQSGDFAAGWAEYEWRGKAGTIRPSGLDKPDWDGAPMAGTLLVHAEQGMGDTIQFARFLAEARKRVGRLVLMCHTALAGPAARIAGVDAAISYSDAPPAHDRVAALLSLPHLLKIGGEFHGEHVYLAPLRDRVAKWRKRLAKLEGLKVGLVWAGNAAHPFDKRRSLVAAQMNLLPRVPGVTYAALQRGERSSDQVGALRPPVLDLGAEIDDVEDTLAILTLLDVVVAVDTLATHLAGAMGKPTILLLPFAADWRWQLGRDDSPWYRNHLLCRQSKPNEWIDPLIRAGVELIQRAAPSGKNTTAATLFQQAIEHHRNKRSAEAELSLWQALARDPRNPRLLLTLGALRVAAGDHISAISLLSHGMLASGPDAEALANLGVALRGEDRLDEAERAYRRALEIAPGFGSTQYNLANLLSARGAWAEAESLYRRALAGNPNHIDALYNLGNAVRDQGRLDEAIAIYRSILELKPDHHAVRNSLGMCLVLNGDFAAGFEAYEARWLSDMVPRGFSQPLWDGKKQARKTLLIHAEQGMGDTIQFLRYVPMAAARFGGKIVLEVQAPLVALAKRLMPKATIVAQNDPLPAFDVRIPLLSLPHLFGTTIDTVPAEVPYLSVPDAKVKAWRTTLGRGSGLKVGLAWAGNPKHKNDRNRSLPFAALENLPSGPGIRYFSLQVGERRAELEGAKLPVEDLGGRIEDFDDTAAILSSLDLLIACDTATAHLAGALGVPVWLLLPFAPDWRWVLSCDDTPWYSTMQLFRQGRHGDWSGPVGAMAELLGALAKSPARKNAKALAEKATALLADLRKQQGRTAGSANQESVADLERAIEAAGTDRAKSIPALTRLAELRANDGPTWHRLGTALYLSDRVDEAEAAMRRALEAAPNLIEAQSDLGAILTRKGDTDIAIAALNRAIEMSPRHAAAYGNLGVALRKAGRAEEAAETLDKALALAPGYPDYHWNRALALLHAGRYADGWREFEWRWKVPGFPSPVRGFKQPLWLGEPLEGKTILLYAEQGLGDAFQFLRYVPMVIARGGRVVLEVPSALVELCACLQSVAQIVPLGQSLPAFDVQTPLASLPLAFGSTLETIPYDVPYLVPDAERLKKWRLMRNAYAGGKPVVGLVWAGRKKPDPTRTVGIAGLKPLLDIPGLRFVGLQKDLEPGEEEVLAGLSSKLENWGGRFESFADTAAAMCTIDLVVSIDTSSAHLAGALGRPTWVMLPRAVDWRWMTGRDDNPWYPTMRLFRRGAKEEWAPVVARIASALNDYAAAPSTYAEIDGDFRTAGELLARGRLDEAEAMLREIVARDATHAEGIHHLGVVALKRRQPREAIALIQRALALNDRNDTAWANLGVAQREAGDSAGAVESYGRALELNPKHGAALYNLGNIHASRGENAAAVDCFRRAVELSPNHANALNNLGLALQRTGALDEAVATLGRAAEIDARGTDAAANLALALHGQKKLPEALAAAHKAIELRPDSALAHRVCALILKAEGQLDQAVQHLARALQIDPKSAEAYNLLGNAYKGLGRPRDAVAAFDKAIAIEANRADARFNRATVLLALGDFKEGWAEYEWRWAAQGFARRSFSQPEWDGKPLAGRTILVHAEQGLGDTIQFARYIAQLAETGKVIAEVQPELVDLLRTIERVSDVVAAGQPLPPFDVHVPLLSLPRLLGTAMSSIPADVPYLRASAGAGAALPDLAHAPGLKVGLVWAGNAAHSGDRWRSIALAELTPILDTPGVTFVSLQKGEASDQLVDAEAAIIDAGPSLANFADTAALVEELDLVIAVDTAAAHCAGALGKPVWVLQSFAPDWRWLLNTPRSPWYPTMRLYRQEKLGDWSPVVRAIAADLAQEVAARRARPAPVIQGEISTIEVKPEVAATKNRKPVVFKWGMSSYFGWGVYGINLMLAWAEDRDILPVCSVPFITDHIVLDALRKTRIEGEIKASRKLIEGLVGHRGGRVDSSALVLHGLGNRFGAVASAHGVDLGGKSNIGVLFIEDSTVDDQMRERAKRFDMLIAGSSWNKSLLDSANIGKPITVVLQGVDRTLFHPAPKSGLFKDRFVVFTGGKLEFRKGQDIALLAFRTFAERHPEALLAAAWHSPWPDLARALTANKGIAPVPFSGGKADLAGWAAANGVPAENFLDLGQVPNAQMPTILRECDAALFTNRAEGGTNLVAMECMASGVPCILSANTGHLDLIKDQTCLPLIRQGQVAPVANFGTEGWGESDVEEAVEALEILWRDRQRAETIGRNGAALLAEMSWSDQMRRLKEVILPYVG